MSILFRDALGRRVCYRSSIQDHPQRPAGLGNLFVGQCPACGEGLLHFVADGSVTPFRCSGCRARFRAETVRLLVLDEDG
ncbi:MAG: hypothetical protein M0Z27_10450 [Thermaerobacter sp.]|jgi:hypothetical protein|nr:hypothetical protein [Thermaerobacter sp.]MDA8146463.1 hypothetical protein [Thermaerobacter sp.]